MRTCVFRIKEGGIEFFVVVKVGTNQRTSDNVMEQVGDYTVYLPGTQSQNVSSNRSPGGHSITRQAVMKMENKSKSMLWNKNLFYITLTK